MSRYLAGTLTPAVAAPDPAPLLRRTARGALLNLAGAGAAGAAGFGVTWLVARGMPDPAGAGAFFTAVATFTLGAGVARLGTQTSLVYWPARLRALGAGRELARCLHCGLTPVAVASVVMAAVLGLAAGRVPAAVAAPLRVLAVFLPLAALTEALLAAARGYQEIRPTLVLDKLLRPALQLGALAVVVGAGAVGTATFAVAWVAPYLPVAALAGYALVRVHGRDGGTTAGLAGVGAAFSARAYWAFTAPRAVASIAQVALQRLDVLLVAALGGLPAAALYAVAGRYVLLGQVASGALAQVAQPRLAERLALGDVPAARALYQQTTAWLVLTTWPLHLLVAANAASYLALFGPRFAAGLPVVWLLAAAMLVATGCGMVDMVLAMAGRTRWNLYNVLFALSTMVGVDLVLIPALGAVGAAAGLAVAVLVNNLVPLTQIHRSLGLHPFGPATRCAAALAAGCCGVPPMLAFAAGAGRAALAGISAAGVATFLAGAFLLRRRLNLHLLKGSP